MMLDVENRGLPARAVLHESGLYLAKRDIAADAMQDAFMHRTIARLPAVDSIVHIATGDIGAAPADTAPAGIIFHVGRCGSTVLSQALRQHGAVVVYSEPLPVNEILSARAQPRALRAAALRSLGAAFSAHAGKRYVIKLSSWTTLLHDIVAEAFPATPWVFSIRDPLEVGEAMMRDTPEWLQGSDAAARYITELADPRSEAASKEDFFARLFAMFCATVARADLTRGRVVEYVELEDHLLHRVLPHFGITGDEASVARVSSALNAYAKAPLRRASAFVPDSDAKRAAASPSLRAAVDDIARPQLQHLRAAFAAR